MSKNEKYIIEAKEKWGNGKLFKEYEEKTKNYSNSKFSELSNEINNIFRDFSLCLDQKVDSPKVQALVKKLQLHITNNYYNCTNDILYCLGQMYVTDERYKSNIDKHLSGTAEFIFEAIKVYCK